MRKLASGEERNYTNSVRAYCLFLSSFFNYIKIFSYFHCLKVVI